MAVCNIHSQSYEVAKGEWCVLCGHPKDQHHHIKSVARRFGISLNTAIKWFKDEPGVIVISESPFNMKRQSRVHLRVPEKVIERVRQRHCKAGV